MERWVDWDEASLDLGYRAEQFVAQAPAWIGALSADAGRNVALARVVGRRKPR